MSAERIESLLSEISTTAEPRTLDRVRELVEELLSLYGDGISRLLSLVGEEGALSERVRRRVVEDETLSALLTLHGLLPEDAEARGEAALERVRPQLGAHAGGVTFLGIDDRRVARIRLEGSCDGCASSASTLRNLVERAIEDAAPDLAGVHVENADRPTDGQLVQIGRRQP
jgi:Fe-S cluster biogenesis protein NfuA